MPVSIGLDLCDDYIIAYSHEDKVMVDVPSVICREKKEDKWYIGENAYRIALGGKGVLTDKLLSLLRKKGTSTIMRRQYTAVQLIAKMIDNVLWQLLAGKTVDSIDRMVIALHTADKETMDGVMEAAAAAGIASEKITIISHAEAFVHYTLSQDKELYNNMAALFDLSDEALSFYRMKAVRGIGRNSVIAEGSELEESFRLGILNNDSGSEIADRLISEAARKCLGGDIYSSVLLTGRGFERTDWAAGFITMICKRRKVLYEKGLFAIGAARRAAEQAAGGEGQFLIFADTRVAAEISMQVYINDKKSKLVLVKAGQPWHTLVPYAEVLLKDQNYVEIDIEPVDRFSRKRTLRIGLESFPERPDRCTRAAVELSFESVGRIRIVIRDLGFGDLFPAGDVVVEESVTI